MGSPKLQGQVAVAFVRCTCSNYVRSGKCIWGAVQCLRNNWSCCCCCCRMIFTNGVATTACTTNSARRTPILTMLGADSSSPTSAGCCARNTPKWKSGARQSTWAIFSKIPLSFTNASIYLKQKKTSSTEHVYTWPLSPRVVIQVLHTVGFAGFVLPACVGTVVLLGGEF